HAAARPSARASAQALAAAIRSRMAVAGSKPLGPAAAPLLALGPIERPSRRSGFFKKKALDPLWLEVLRAEAEVDRDWPPAPPWLEEMLGGIRGHAVFHYMLGLGAWQRDDRQAARKNFAACLAD